MSDYILIVILIIFLILIIQSLWEISHELKRIRIKLEMMGDDKDMLEEIKNTLRDGGTK